tara:strand:- start:43 stop:321 length:279 start_codon:yes stop_codon:yes gene_type:complete
MKKMNNKLNYARWRAKAHKVLSEKGEMDMDSLLYNIGYFRFAPVNVNSATQTLLKDDRFLCRTAGDDEIDFFSRTPTGEKYRVMVWSVIDEN